MQRRSKSLSSHWRGWLAAGIAILALAFVLAWVSARFQGAPTWPAFLAVLLLAGVILYLGWQTIRSEAPPGWLGYVVLGAALLRLAAGVTWYLTLPELGYHSPGEQAGYVMADAYDRDQAAWELAESEKPLRRAFQGGYRKADQYGGLLFLSSLVYRTLGGGTHTPLLMVVVTASFSALAVLYSWGFARRAWGAGAGAITALVLTIYPEAVLIGSSQMREAFSITLVASAFYGLIRFWQERSSTSLIIILVSLAACLPFSPPFTALVLAALVVEFFALGWARRGEIFSGHSAGTRWLWLVIGGVAALATVGLWLSWKSFAPPGVTNPLEIIGWWARKSADWQAHLSERASGWMQKIFDSTPTWMHLPLLLSYGIVQPFLPAALVDFTGAAIWQAIAIWRALGWAILLPFLVYAPLRALRGVDRHSADGLGRALGVKGLSLVVWMVILIASYRSGGDQWDNPRYRAAFAGLQIALLAWTWAAQRRNPEPWLGRALIASGLTVVWFVPWYLRRYLHLPWPVEDLFKTLGLGVATAALYLIWVQTGRTPTNRSD